MESSLEAFLYLAGIDKENIKAKYKNGILEIYLLKKPEEKPKEITIEAN